MPLLTPADGPAYREIIGLDEVPLLLICDHASNRVPERLGDLGGIPAEEFQRHIALDIGAERVTELMAERLGCSAVLGQFSRLVLDLNRYPEDHDFITAHSFGTDIPANRDLSPAARQERIDEIFLPFHGAVKAALRRLEAKHDRVMVMPIHSFGPYALPDSPKRPWDIGVLWNRDGETAARLLAHLRRHTGLIVGDNEPYSMKTHSCYAMNEYAEGKRPGVLIEIRNDNIGTEEGCAFYANLLADFCSNILTVRQEEAALV